MTFQVNEISFHFVIKLHFFGINMIDTLSLTQICIFGQTDQFGRFFNYLSSVTSSTTGKSENLYFEIGLKFT